MARLFDFGPEARGIFAVGQGAQGFFALGQFARGVVVVGQFAVGVVAIGQFAFGLVSLGMFSAGLLWSAPGPAGTSAVRILSLVPRVTPVRERPQPIAFAALTSGGDSSGWLAVQLDRARGRVTLTEENQPLPVRLDARLRAAASSVVLGPADHLFAYVERVGSSFICTRLLRADGPDSAKPGFWAKTIAKTTILAILSAAFWLVVAEPLLSD